MIRSALPSLWSIGRPTCMSQGLREKFWRVFLGSLMIDDERK